MKICQKKSRICENKFCFFYSSFIILHHCPPTNKQQSRTLIFCHCSIHWDGLTDLLLLVVACRHKNTQANAPFQYTAGGTGCCCRLQFVVVCRGVSCLSIQYKRFIVYVTVYGYHPLPSDCTKIVTGTHDERIFST